MSELDTKFDIEKDEESIDIKKIIYTVLHQWYWFLLFGILGLGLAFLYTKVKRQDYQASTSILLKNNTNGINVSDLFKGVISQPKNNVTDQMDIISSYTIVNKALKNLDWRTEWFKKDFWKWNDLYKTSPFIVSEVPGFQNPTEGKIYITPVSRTQYKINTDFKFGPNEIPIEFNALGTFGQIFKNKFFQFTLSLKDPQTDLSGSRYYFVFNDLGTATLNYQKLVNTTTGDRNNQSDVIVCSMKGEDPQKEVDFLNSLISTYIQEKLNVQNETQLKTLKFINGQLKEFSDSLSRASNNFVTFRSQNKIIDLTQEGTIIMDSLAHIESDKASIQLQLDYYKNLQKYLSQSDSLKQIVAPAVVGNKDVLFDALVLQMNHLYNKKAVLTFNARKNNPALVLLNSQITHTKEQMQESLHNRIGDEEQFLRMIKTRESMVTKLLIKLPKKEQQMITLQNKYNIMNQIYTYLLQNKAQTSITMASNVPDVQVIDVARMETTIPVGVSHKIIILFGLILGLLVPGIFLLFRDFFDDRIRTQEDVEKHTQLPILANILHSDDPTDMAVFDDPKSSLAESFRTLRTNLQFMLNGSAKKVIGIHSTNPSEGKSFNALNLATILAMNNKKVVLLGADLRKPRLHESFNLPNHKGISTYLISQNTLEEILLPTQIKNLSIIPSGPIPPNPAEILGKPEMNQLLDELRNRFDFIVIDNAPVGLVTDGIITGHLADVNIFILRYGFSQRHNIEFINQESERKTIEHVALVVNDIKAGAFGYTYYKYYHYEHYQHAYYSDHYKGKKWKWRRKS